jgi:apolipoprotein N-acyltransferase
VVLANEALCALAVRRRLGLAAGAAALIAAAAFYGNTRLADVRARTAAAPTFTAGIVQANILTYDKLAAERGTYDAVVAILDAHFALSERLLADGKLDLLVWPETVYPTTLGHPKSEAARDFDAAIVRLSQHVPLVLGAFDADPAGEYNAAFFLGKRFSVYRKSLLFPMTERLPTWLDTDWARRAMPWAGRWRAGPGPSVLLLEGVPFGPLICYEALDAEYVAEEVRIGARVLMVLSNDGWFTEPGARLHLMTAAFRSIETRRPMLRAANSGISTLVLPDGTLVDPTRFASETTLRVRVPLLSLDTPMIAWGHFLGPVSLALAALLAVLRRRLP